MKTYDIDDLRGAMARYTATIPAPENLAPVVRRHVRRQRGAVGVAGFLAVVAIAVGVASIVKPSDNNPAAPLAELAANEVRWPYRGTLPVEKPTSIDVEAYDAWAAKHGAHANEMLGLPLLGVSPTPTTFILLFEAHVGDSAEGSLAVYVKDAAGGRIAYDAIATLSTTALSVRVSSGGVSYVLAVAAPGRVIVGTSSRAGWPIAPMPQTPGPRGETSTGEWAVYAESAAGQAGFVRVTYCASCNGTYDVAILQAP